MNGKAFTTIKEALAQLDLPEGDASVNACRIKATIYSITHSEKNYYAGCPNKDCEKKLIPDTYGWSCATCNKS